MLHVLRELCSSKFFIAYDELRFELIKVAGQSRAFSHDNVQFIFSLVNKEARRALTLWIGYTSKDSKKNIRTSLDKLLIGFEV